MDMETECLLHPASTLHLLLLTALLSTLSLLVAGRRIFNDLDKDEDGSLSQLELAGKLSVSLIPAPSTR